jgi:hypothetical protein
MKLACAPHVISLDRWDLCVPLTAPWVYRKWLVGAG